MNQHMTGLTIDARWIADELLKERLITEKDYQRVLANSRSGDTAAPLLVVARQNLKHSDADAYWDVAQLLQWLSAKSGLPIYKIDALKMNVPAVTAVMSVEFAERHRLLAVEVQEDRVVIATDQPFDRSWEEQLRPSLNYKQIDLVLIHPEQLQRFINEFYHVTQAIAGARDAKTASIPIKGVEAFLELGNIQNPDANDQHIVRIVDWLLQYAFEQRASDIHLEIKREQALVRLRIDGILHTVYTMPAAIMVAVIARIKIIGRINVAEKRKPQDGRLKTRTPLGVETELRLSTLPTAFGEKMVLRIFDPEVLVRSFDDLGLTGDDLRKWKTMAAHANGIILVTGPTGSGKTTTLYSTLKQLATSEVNVCTIEDPIEMIEPAFNQMQVQPNIDLGFAEGVRALMRQDPDIIMVGEIRDQQTADMAIQAALTGHLVLSTLHTNDAPSSLTRLHDLGVPPFLSAATLLGIMAQRLVRKLCVHCKQPTTVDAEVWHELVSPWRSKLPDVVYQPVGCEHCRQTGYKGRIGIYEILVLSTEMKRCIAEGGALNDLKTQAYKEGLLPLRIAGARKIAEGVTSISEVFRVAPLT